MECLYSDGNEGGQTMSASRNAVMEIVARKMKIANVEDMVDHMPQSTEDFFRSDDRKELYKQTAQLEVMMRDLTDMKFTIRDNARTNTEAFEAHEKRIRVLEDERLRLRTYWAAGLFLSGLIGTLVSITIRILFK